MIDKEARTLNEIHPVLKKRWSPRAFDSRRIETDKINRFLEAAAWSPSSQNLQPWHFILGFKGDNSFGKIFSTLVEFNQLWTKNVPLLVLTVANTMNKEGRPSGIYLYDIGQAAAHLTFQATADGLYVHQMTGFNSKLADELFGIPEGYKSVSVIAVGYMGNPETLPEKFRKMELSARNRIPYKDKAFADRFGQSADL